MAARVTTGVEPPAVAVPAKAAPLSATVDAVTAAAIAATFRGDLLDHAGTTRVMLRDIEYSPLSRRERLKTLEAKRTPRDELNVGPHNPFHKAPANDF
jgi:hypothetical protein